MPKHIDPSDKILGLRLRGWRERVGLDHGRLALTLGLAEAHVRRCEEGAERPDFVAAFAWAEACGVPWQEVRDVVKEAIQAQDAARRPAKGEGK